MSAGVLAVRRWLVGSFRVGAEFPCIYLLEAAAPSPLTGSSHTPISLGSPAVALRPDWMRAALLGQGGGARPRLRQSLPGRIWCSAQTSKELALRLSRVH